MKIDLNCDVGEGIGNEAQLMPYISSCNIACGAHAGSIEIIDEVIRLAQKNHVKIGAHPSYPDRENFGRLVMKISNDELEDSLIRQITLLENRTKVLTGKSIHHVKPHGALYNVSAKSEEVAKVVLTAIKKTVPQSKLYVPYNSVIEKMALKHNFDISYEIFADRNYLEDLSLVPRSQPNALLKNEEEVCEHVLNMVANQKVKTVSGKQMTIKADTCCLHGDNVRAIRIIKFLNKELKENGISIG